MVLLVVFVILIGLLRAFTGPLLLTLTVVLSFFAALGVGAVVFDVVFGLPGSDPSIPLFAFVFLVALGIDYNIFLMARVREETLRHGTRDGMLRASPSRAASSPRPASCSRDVLRPRRPAAGLPAADRLPHRLRRHPRHVRRAVDPRAGARPVARQARVVAVAPGARGRAAAGGPGRRGRAECYRIER
jgi:hypothetical protein